MERFGKYELLAKLGQGGMAEVYLARATLAEGLQKLLTIKKIHPAFSENPHFVSMFKQEAKISTELNHPNIVQVFDFGKLGTSFFLAMEYVEGMDLMRLIKKGRRRLPIGLAAYIVQQLAQGLDYAHKKKDSFGSHLGIVHRDVSPQNILVSFDGAVKITDFGIAKARSHEEEKGVVKGKFHYMAPEQALGQEVDARADIFSTGVVLYELVCGRTFFADVKGSKVLDAIRSKEIPSPTEFREDIPDGLVDIIMRAVARNPEQRFGTGREMQTALVRFLYALHGETQEIYDAEALAEFLSEEIPEKDKVSAEALIRSYGSVSKPSSIATQASLEIGVQGDVLTDTKLVERKKIVVISGRFEGWESFAAEVGKGKANRFLKELKRNAEDVAYKLDARIKSFSESGVSFVLGVPISGENDSSRGIRLAGTLVESWEQAIHDASRRLAIRFGLARGQAEVKRGHAVGFEYKLLGKVADLSLLLAGHADPGGVVVGGGVRNGARHEWEFVEIGTTDFRGLAAEDGTESAVARSVKMYSVKGPKPRAERRGSLRGSDMLIGRDLELRGLKDAFRQVVMHRRSRVLAIVGEAGVGKRSLVDGFLGDMEDEQNVVLRATAKQWEQNLPYSVIRDLCRDLFQVEDWATRKDLKEKIDLFVDRVFDGAGEDLKDIKEVFYLLMGAVPPAQLALPADPEHRQRRVGKALQSVLVQLARHKPLVVVLEEFHWADFQSRQLLRKFITSLPDRPILAIITSRPEDDLREMFGQGLVDPLYLQELGENESRQLVSLMFLDPKSVEPLINQILAKGGGNPYFLNAILESLVDQGICETSDGDPEGRLVWKKKDVTVTFPPTVEALVSARLDQLPAEERSVLRRASVLGRYFQAKNLSALVEGGISKALESLVSRGLLVKEEDERYHFAKQVILDIAHQGLSSGDIKRLHKKVADLMSEREESIRGRAALIAWHNELAGYLTEAGKYYWYAAREARDLNGNKEAFHFLNKAAKLIDVDDKSTLFEVHWKREKILGEWGRRKQQKQTIEELEKIASMMQETLYTAKVLSRWMNYFQVVSKPKDSLSIFNKAWEKAEKSGEIDLKAEILRLKARALNEVGENTAALEALRKARNLCSPEEQTTEPWGWVWHIEGNVLLYVGDYRSAVAAYTKAREIYRRLGLRRQEGTILNNMGFISLNLGRFEEAIKYLKASSSIDVELGNRDALGVKLSNLGQVYNSLGCLDKAMKHLLKAEELCRSVQESSYQADAVISIGQVHMNRGDYKAAVAELKRGLQIAIDADGLYDIVRAQIYLSSALVSAGDSAQEAYELAMQATKHSRDARMPQGEVFGQSMASRALISLGRTEEALGLSAQAVARLSTCGHVAESEVVLLNHSIALIKAARAEEARPYLEKALQEVRKKKASITKEEHKKSYLSVPPAKNILLLYKEHFKD